MQIEVRVNELHTDGYPEVIGIRPEVKITDVDVYSYDTDLVEELEREMELLVFKELGKALVQGHYDYANAYPEHLPHSPTLEIRYHTEPTKEAEE